MKKTYMISRIILTVITFVLFSIMVINEDTSAKIIPIIFSSIVFGLSFPSTIFAKKIIEKGNKIENTFLKIGYYIILPIILLLICLISYMIITYIGDNFIITPNENEIGDALGKGLNILFIEAVVVIAIILPYIQSIIINIIKKIIK